MLLLMCAGVVFTFRGCKKEGSLVAEPKPEMIYTEHGLLITGKTMTSIDLDGDGIRDLNFQVQPVSDPSLKVERKQFNVYSRIHSALLNDRMDQSPVLTTEERIRPNHPGFDWWEIAAVVLAEKITLLNGSTYWKGDNMNENKYYLPVRIAQQRNFHYGWLEFSIDKENETLVIHRSGIAKEAGKVVVAGK